MSDPGVDMETLRSILRDYGQAALPEQSPLDAERANIQAGGWTRAFPNGDRVLDPPRPSTDGINNGPRFAPPQPPPPQQQVDPAYEQLIDKLIQMGGRVEGAPPSTDGTSWR